MPTRHTVQDALLELKLEGHFTIPDALQALEDAIATASPGRRPNVLLDVTQSAELETMEELRRAAVGFGDHTEELGHRIAILVVQPVRFGIARQFGVCLEEHGFDFNVFTERGKAVAWLQPE